MKSLEYLKKEERFIESLLEILDYFTLRLDNNKDVPPYMLKELIELLQIFIDTFHTARERIILQFLGTCGIDAPIQECDQIHAKIEKYNRFLLRVVEAYDLGYNGAKWILAFHGKQYICTLRQLLMIENELLTRWVDNQEKRDREILEEFKKIDYRVKRTRERGRIRMESLKKESRRVTAQ